MRRHLPPPLDPLPASVLGAVRHLGAVTTRRLIRDHGPRAAWEELIAEGWLSEYESVHGPLIGLGSRARQYYSDQGLHAPYLTGPSAVLDRAYQQDALEAVMDAGYEVMRPVYKRVTGIHRNGRTHTSQIIRHILREPGCREPELYQEAQEYKQAQVKGHPSLYATIAGGGLTEQRLQRLIDRHRDDVTSIWNSPLLIAVPNPPLLRSTIRRVNAQRAADVDEHERNFPLQPGKLVRVLVILIHIPHPEGGSGRL